MNEGIVKQVMGPVVDIAFETGELPEIYNAIRLTNPAINNKKDNLTVEVAMHLGEKMVRCVAMDSTDGLTRGMKALDTGEKITMPVGRETLGRIMNVTGDPVDELGEIKTKKRLPIHRRPPTFDEQATEVKSFETGIKVINLLPPYPKA